MNYILHILIITSVYAVLAVSLNMLAGYSGLLSICHAAFYGIGAYSTALLLLHPGWSWIYSVIVGMMIAGAFALIIGYTSLRFRDDYFVIATLAFQIILYNILQNWIEVTRGPIGIGGIQRPNILGWSISSQFDFLLLAFIMATLTFLFVRRLMNAPYGRVLKAIREDEIFAQSFGKNTSVYKLAIFVMGAMLASISGSFYASYISYIDPSSFSVNESIFILAIVIIGGAGNVWGSLVGAALLVVLPESLRFLGLQASFAANIRQILFACLLIIFMMLRPQGLFGDFHFQKNGSGR